MEHQLKIWPKYYDAVAAGEKTFELRDATERIFNPGDVLFLREWCPLDQQYTGRSMKKVVTYVLQGEGLLKLRPDIAVLGLGPELARYPVDGVTRLSKELYGKVDVGKILGGSDAPILHDAAERIVELADELIELKQICARTR